MEKAHDEKYKRNETKQNPMLRCKMKWGKNYYLYVETKILFSPWYTSVQLHNLIEHAQMTTITYILYT